MGTILLGNSELENFWFYYISTIFIWLELILFFPPSSTRLLTVLTRRVSNKKHKLLTLYNDMGSSPYSYRTRVVAHHFSFCVVFLFVCLYSFCVVWTVNCISLNYPLLISLSVVYSIYLYTSHLAKILEIRTNKKRL
jgi:hypothetical protein